ncbi:MAG TPA: transposase [Terriglobales bacterium]|nr:transposase [Terriglobales bacterium]
MGVRQPDPAAERDLPELLSLFAFPSHLWRKLRTTNVIERCFAGVRRRTRPVVCIVSVESVDRIIYSVFQRFNGKPAPSPYLHKQVDVTSFRKPLRRAEIWTNIQRSGAVGVGTADAASPRF